MTNNTVKPTSNGGNIGTVLTTLASSGDNWVKLLIVAGLVLNGYWSKSAERGTTTNGRELDALREQMARQVKVIHGNQRTYVNGINEGRQNDILIMEKLGIPHKPFTPYQPSKVEEDDQ